MKIHIILFSLNIYPACFIRDKRNHIKQPLNFHRTRYCQNAAVKLKCAAQWCIDDGWLEWRACIPIIIYNPFTLDFPPKQSRHDLPSGPPDNVLRTFGKCVLFIRVHPYTGCPTKHSSSDICKKLSHHFLLHFPIGMRSYVHHAKYQGVFP